MQGSIRYVKDLQKLATLLAFSGVNLTIILLEFKMNPKCAMTCLGIKHDFSG